MDLYVILGIDFFIAKKLFYSFYLMEIIKKKLLDNS